MQLSIITTLWKANSDRLTVIVPRIFRATKLRTSVTELGVGSIVQIFIGDSLDSEMVGGGIDAYYYSNELVQKLRQEFLKEHGLEKASDAEIDRYCDENEIGFSDPTRVELPTIKKDGTITITGMPAKSDFFLMLFGISPDNE